MPEPRNPKCYVCSEKREVTITLNVETFTLKAFEEKVGEIYLIISTYFELNLCYLSGQVLKSGLGMVAPDVEIDGQGLYVL